MSYIITGNIIALIASLMMVYSGLIKEKKKIIFIEIIEIILFIISNIFLGGFTAAINNFFNCVRNVLCYKNKLGIKEKILITILSTIFSIVINNLGFIGLLPLISTIIYLWLMNIKDIINFKYLVIFTMIMWFIYDITIKSYVAALFDFAFIISNVISIISIKQTKNKEMTICGEQ